MNCEQLRELLADLVSGESLGELETAAREHLGLCSSCAARVAALRNAERAVRDIAPAWGEAGRAAPLWHDVARAVPVRGAVSRRAKRAAAAPEVADDFDAVSARVGRANARRRPRAGGRGFGSWARLLARAAAVVLIAAGLHAVWNGAGSGPRAPAWPRYAGPDAANAGTTWSVMLSRRALETLRSSDDLAAAARAPLAAAARRFPDSPTLSWSLLALAKR